MARLKLIQKRAKFSLNIPHKILINNVFVGIMKTSEIQIEMPPGHFKITIQSMFPFISAEKEIDVEEGVDNVLEFWDREKWWDRLLVIDIVMWVLQLFLTLPPKIDLAYKIFTYGIFILWLIYEWCIRKNYFRMEFYKKISSIS